MPLFSKMKLGRRSVSATFSALVWAVMLGSHAARAEELCLTPTEDVVTAVMFRAEPNSESALLGRLEPGVSVAVIGDVPRWNQVRLADGAMAYVSKRWTVIVPCGPLVPAAPSGADADVEYRVHVLDVGTGLSVFVEGPDFTLLYDAGSNDDPAAGDNNRVLAYLREISPDLLRIDHLVLSHPHQDHVALMPDVVRHFEIGEVWNSGAYNDICSYRALLQAISEEDGVRYHTATRGSGTEALALAAKCHKPAQTLQLRHDDQIGLDPLPLGAHASMQFLYADGSQKTDFNDNSLVLKLTLGPHSVLFMGDAGGGGRQDPSVAPKPTSVEGGLLDCCQAALTSDVMIVGHHGSKTSSRVAFLDAVNAQDYIVSSGPKAYSGTTLPDAEVIAALEARGRVWRTDADDEECAAANTKTGTVADGKPGGCSAVLVRLSAQSVIAEYQVAP